MSTAPSMSQLSRMILSDQANLSSGVGTNTVRVNLDSSTLRAQHQLIRAQGNRGRRSRDLSRVRTGNRRVTGNVVSTPSDTELDYWLPWAMGGSLTEIGNTLAKRYIGFDKVAEMFTYSGCVVSRLNLSAQVGQPVVLTADIEGTDEADLATWPADDPGLDVAGESFFILSDLTLTVAGTARQVPGFSLTLDNFLDSERFMNAATREHIPSQDCQISLEVEMPYNADNTGLYTITDEGVAGSMALSDGTDTYTITFGKLVAEQDGASVEERQEIRLPLTLEALRDGVNGTAQMAVVKS